MIVAITVVAAACSGSSSTRRRVRATTTSSSTSTSAPSSTSTTSPAIPTCRVGQLAAELASGSPGAGQRYASITFTNNGAAPCSMLGYLGLQLLDEGGVHVATTVVRTTGAPKALVVLAPGGQAFTTLHWGVVPGDGEPADGACEPTASQVEITPPNETHSLVQPWTLGLVCQQGAIDTPPVQAGAAPPG